MAVRPLTIPCEQYLLRPLTPADVDVDYVAWFNSDYVNKGLNVNQRRFIRQEHLDHIAMVARSDSELLVIQEKDGPRINSYVKVDIDTRRAIATFTIALDRSYEDRRRMLNTVVWHAVRHFLNVRKLQKISMNINRSNIAAWGYMKESEFKLDGVLRSEVVYKNGKRDDLLAYSLVPSDLINRWGKVSPFTQQA